MYSYLHSKVNMMRACFLILLLIFLAGCGPVGCGPDSSPSRKSGQTPVPQTTPTLTPVATMIPSPTSTATTIPSPTKSRPSPTPIATSVPSPTAIATTIPHLSLESSLHNTPVSADIPVPGEAHGLHLYSVEGLQCPIRRFPLAPSQSNLYVGPSDYLVLATGRLAYSKDEIQEMRNYLNKIYNNTASITTSYLIPPPSTLQCLPGVSRCE